MKEGISFVGAGSRNQYLYADKVSLLKLPATPAVNVPMFRFAAADTISYTNGIAGVRFRDLEFSGTRFSEAQSVPSAVSGYNAVGISFKTKQKKACTVNTSTDAWTCTGHGFSTAEAVQFSVVGGTVPTKASGTFYNDFTYFVRVSDANTFTLHPTATDATNNTNKIDITNAGTGTDYVGSAIHAAHDVVIERCFLRHFDKAVEGSDFFDEMFIISTSYLWCNVIGYDAQEQPEIRNSSFAYNRIGVTGRLTDFTIDGCEIVLNLVGVGPKGTVNGNAFQTDASGEVTFVGAGRISDSYLFKNTNVAIRCYNNTNIDSCSIIGDEVANQGYIGVDVQGNQCRISNNNFGQGAPGTSFNYAAILLGAPGGADNANTQIDGNNFAIATAGIGMGDSSLASPLYNSGALGSRAKLQITNNNFALAGTTARAIYFVTTTGTVRESLITGNYIYATSGLSSSDGVIEGPFYNSTLTNNYGYKNGTSAGFLIKSTYTLDAVSVYAFNRATGWTTGLSLGTTDSPTCKLFANTNVGGNYFSNIGTTRCLGQLLSANFNSTADQSIRMTSSRYIIDYIVVDNASTSLTTAAGGVYPTTSKGGTAVVASSQVYTALTASSKYVALTLAGGVATDVNTATTLYLSLTTGQGSTATADVRVYGRDLQG